MPQLKHQITKTLHIRPNDRSSDFVTPNFIYGCAGGCRNSYCYVMRYNYDHIYVNDNTEQILAKISQHAAALVPKKPNQVDPVYWVYDIGCSTDIALHWKQYDWSKVFDLFRDTPNIKATFATKYVNEHMLDYEAHAKIRIRFSLMPQSISTYLEPKTSLIEERIRAIAAFMKAGYEVHVNFSPIVIYPNWQADYQALFELLDQNLTTAEKISVKAEAIFLTHNAWQHERNLQNGKEKTERLLWQPHLQEAKLSEYGSQALRYKRGLKKALINEWLALHDKIIPWNTVRYIF